MVNFRILFFLLCSLVGLVRGDGTRGRQLPAYYYPSYEETGKSSSKSSKSVKSSKAKKHKKHHMDKHHYWKKKYHGYYSYYDYYKGYYDLYGSHDGYYYDHPGHGDHYHPHSPHGYYPSYPNPSPVPPPTPTTPTLAPSIIPVISILSEPPTSATNTNIPATEEPTVSAVESDELQPPKPEDVVERTSAPTPQAVPAVETFSIHTDTLSFRASGMSDLGEHEVEFFEEVERVLAPFARTEVGPQLTKFLLSIVFEHDKLDVVSLGMTGQNTLYRSVFQISSVFDLEGTSEEITFNREAATGVLSSLFKDQLLQRILLSLANRGIRISNIAEYDPDADEDSDSRDQVPTLPQDRVEKSSSDNSPRNAALITLFSGGLVVLALGLALLINLRRRRRRYFHYGESVARASYASRSVSSGINSDSGSKVQRAALATKSYSSSDFLRPNVATSSSLAPVLDDIEKSYSDFYNPSSHQEEKSEVEPLDPPATFLPPANHESTDTIGATLTNLNGCESISDLNSAYPEFEMFVGLKQPSSPETQYDIPPQSPPAQNQQGSPGSPYWSVDGAIKSNSETDDEEYLEDRRRWQEEANDIGLGTVPDHVSSRDDSDSEQNSQESEESEEGWSDENESYDERKNQVLPDLD